MNSKFPVGTLGICGLLAGATLMSGCIVAGPPVVTTRAYEPGYVATTLPRGYVVREYRGEPYYVVNNVCYRRTSRGYVVVNSPFGATVRTYHAGYVTTALPAGYTVRRYHGRDYYVAGNTWYRPHPRGYVVVNPPR